jgi:APA family basic amino acid/polyamine antiporter
MPKAERDGISTREVKLKRSLGLFEVTAYGVGIILGAGIYALIGPAAGLAGNALWMSFGIAAVIATITGLSYAELGSMYPKASAEYIFSQKAFNHRSLSFLIGWLMIYITIVASATVALGFGGYLFALTGMPVIASAILLVVILTGFNLWGMKESSKLNVVLTIIEAGGLLLIISLAFGHFGSVNYFETSGVPNGIFLAAILVFFAYLGFEDIDRVSEETKNPRRTIPLALLISIAITTVLYMGVSIAAVSIMPWQQLAASPAPLADAAASVLPGSGTFISLIALCAIASTVLVLLISGSRLIYGMSSEGSLPRPLKIIHPVRRTPWIAVLLIGGAAAALTLVGKIQLVAEMTDLGAFMVFVVVNLAVITLRYTRPSECRPFKVPFSIGRFPILPALGVAFCVYMLSQFSVLLMLFAGVVLVAGAIAYGLLMKLGKIDN